MARFDALIEARDRAREEFQTIGDMRPGSLQKRGAGVEMEPVVAFKLQRHVILECLSAGTSQDHVLDSGQWVPHAALCGAGQATWLNQAGQAAERNSDRSPSPRRRPVSSV